MSAGVAPQAAVSPGETGTEVFSNRFLLVTVASQRALQIHGGSRVRVERGIHKAPVLAVAEVLAGWVPYALVP